MITAENITIRRGVHNVVNDISWVIHENEHWLLFGLNGCGKTTLLSALAGYLGINEGKLLLNGIQPLNSETKTAWRLKTGFISASFFDRCFQSESVLNIVLSSLYGRLGVPCAPQSADVRRAKALLHILGIDKKYHYPYDTLSSGQRQKVLFARALITNPDILFLDEPFNGLDILGYLQAKELLQAWQSAGNKTIVCVTHHTSEITTDYTHAALMKNGRFLAAGAIQDIFTSSNICDLIEKDVTVSWQDGRLSLHIPTQKGGQSLWAK